MLRSPPLPPHPYLTLESKLTKGMSWQWPVVKLQLPRHLVMDNEPASIIVSVLLWNNVLQAVNNEAIAPQGKSDTLADHSNYDLIIRRSNDNAVPAVYEQGLSRADQPALCGLGNVLSSLQATLEEAEKINKIGFATGVSPLAPLWSSPSSQPPPPPPSDQHSQNPLPVMGHGRIILTKAIDVLGFYASVYGRGAVARDNNVSHRPTTAPPLSVNQLSTGDLIRNTQINPPNMAEFKVLASKIVPTTLVDPIDQRAHQIAEKLVGLFEQLDRQDYDTYRSACKELLRSANQLLFDIEMITKVVDPSLTNLTEFRTQPNEVLLSNFRNYHDSSSACNRRYPSASYLNE